MNFIQQELQTNFNKRSRTIDNAIDKFSPYLNATELLVLNYFAKQRNPIYPDRNELANKLGRCINSISAAIVSLVNLNILSFECDTNLRTKKRYLRKKKYILNFKTSEWQKKSRADYRLQEQRFVSSLKSVEKQEFYANLVLATDEIPFKKMHIAFNEVISKARFIHKTDPNFFKENILNYGLGFILEWLDSVSITHFVEGFYYPASFAKFVKAQKGHILMAQKVVFHTRHKTLNQDHGALEYLQFEALIANIQKLPAITDRYRSTLYRHHQRMHNMDVDAFHQEKHTIEVRRILLANNLVPLEKSVTSYRANSNIAEEAIDSQWSFINGFTYPVYQHQPVQRKSGKIYRAKSYEYALKTAEQYCHSGRVKPISNKDKEDYLKTDVFNPAVADIQQFFYQVDLHKLNDIRSQEEMLAKGIDNLVKLWDIGAITDSDLEIGYQILKVEASTLPCHCNEAKFDTIRYIDGLRPNYKQAKQLREITKYLCVDSLTLNYLEQTLNEIHEYQGAFKQDTFESYLKAKFSPEIAQNLIEEKMNGYRTLYLDPFKRLCIIKESVKDDVIIKNSADYEQEIEQFNTAFENARMEEEQNGYCPLDLEDLNHIPISPNPS